jgi:valyl-tRNA synthetase
MVLPPPNVTGILTFGHSLGGTLQDILVRWQRMKGIPTLWVPGVDHAGLATQMAVRKHLEKEGVDIHDLTEQELLARIDRWRNEKETYIRKQLTAHGFSLDWSHYVYTMSESYRMAVKTAFLRLYRKGVIYRAERMVNWDPKALTALSDLEVIPTETKGHLWYIHYPASDGGEGITVATTRPETMFGDVALAVGPDDKRHERMVGKTVLLPLTDRHIPVITDKAVDPEFGNGALKITPSHDPVDHEIALRHPELPSRRDVIDERGHLAGEFVPEKFRGMERFAARIAVIAELEEEGLLVEKQPYTHNVGYSERTDVPVEPRLSTQWFLDVSDMGRRALESVKEGRVKIHPDWWTKTYFHFMENLDDWCISRQILWGHSIPVWYCNDCGSYDAYEERPETCPKCGAKGLHQETDVLDTWFSSWLWPFATLGWPKETADLASYYPVSVLVTGSDIVFFWVARMIMGGLQFMDREPFPDVYLHGILTDREGRKLSKHLGNSPDPIEFIEKWGADTFRFAIVFPNPVDQGGYWDGQKMMEGARNFLTKTWNLVRFFRSVIPEGTLPASTLPSPGENLFDRWLLSRWTRVSGEVEEALAHYEFTRAASVLHQFLWHELADWYVEAQKDVLKGSEGDGARKASSSVALYVIEGTLRLLHPFVPHVTEELWHSLPHDGELLAEASWPVLPGVAAGTIDEGAEARVAALQELARSYRALRKEGGWPESARPKGYATPTTALAREILASKNERRALLQLSHLEDIEIIPAGEKREGALAAVVPSGEVFLPKHGGETGSRDAMVREQKMVQGLLDAAKTRLEDPVFRQRAPEKVVRETEQKVAELSERIKRIEQHLSEAR